MKQSRIAILAGILAFAFLCAPAHSDSDLPEDLPFPEEANSQVQDSTSASMIQIAVAFSFKSDPEEMYSSFRDYVVANGYEIIGEGKW